MYDRRGMNCILKNVLSNAIKFTRPGGKIAVSAGSTPEGAVILSVADSGIGISESRLAEIVKPFRQGNSDHDRAYEGVGLGLSMASSIAKLHDSTLEVASTEGVGTTVTLRIPQSRTVPRTAKPEVRDAA